MREGDQFGSYLLEERLAAGGMAEIFRARRLGAAGFARQVCIKRILPALCAERSFVEMFIDEARTGAQLRHGNIVAIDDFGEVAGQYFLCMELVSGTDLARLLRTLAQDGKACPTAAALFVVAEVLKALDYAHRKVGSDGKPLGIVHRDVSPHNVLVSFAGEVKLTDFGIAKAASRLHQTAGNVVKGKLAYLAPEQILGRVLDGRCDVFALGVVLFEALAGRRPFVGANDTAVLHAILAGERPALRALRPDVPEAVEAFVDRLLARDPSQRFASAGAALAAAVALPGMVSGARMLAGMLGHYFPGRASAVQGEGGFDPAMLPSAVTPAGQNQLLAEVRHDAARDPDAGVAPTEVSRVLEAAPGTDPTAGATTTTTTTTTTGGEATAVTRAPPEFDPEVMGAAIPATAVATGTFVLPAAAPPASEAATRADAPRRETSPLDATRTMMAPGAALASAPPREADAPAAIPLPPRDAPRPAAPPRAPSSRANVALALLGGAALLAAASGTAYLLLAAPPRLRAVEPPTPASSAAIAPPPPPAVTRGALDAPSPSPGGSPAASIATSSADAAVFDARESAAAAPDDDARAPATGAQHDLASAADAGGAAAVERGTLLVQAVPWALVAIDGRARGQTPVRASVPAGRHSVELSFPPDHAVRRRHVTVEPGGRAAVNERFSR